MNNNNNNNNNAPPPETFKNMDVYGFENSLRQPLIRPTSSS